MFDSGIGFVHTVCAIIALFIGGLVVVFGKGTRRHKFLGYIFVSAMVLMNVTALFTQSIYAFGPFHWMAIGSLLFVIVGVCAPVFFRTNQNWLMIHYDLMLWSYVGLVAALFSEIAVRVPAVGQVIGGDTLFWVLVIASSLLTFLIGGFLIVRNRRRYF